MKGISTGKVENGTGHTPSTDVVGNFIFYYYSFKLQMGFYPVAVVLQ
jgi:hypothetical protein